MESSKHVIVVGTGPIPDLPSFDEMRTYPNDLLTAIEEYACKLDSTLFYIYPGQLAPWSEIYAAILAGFPVCIPTAAALAQTANHDFITFSHAIFLYPMLRAVIYADSRAELLEPPHIFLKDRSVVPSPEPLVALLSAGSSSTLLSLGDYYK